MRIAALYDIHGNLPALEAVLDEVRAANVDEIVVGGDVVPGPMGPETLALLASLDIPVAYIIGNCEVAVLAEINGTKQESMPESAREIVRWTASHLGTHAIGMFAGWPKTLRRGRILFCHGTPRHDNEVFTKRTPEAALMPVFENVDADVVVCGHTHMQFDRTVGRVRVVNAGSVGMPFGPPGADWLLIGPEIELRHTQYDLDDAAARIRRSDYPDAENFAAHSVLAPPLAEAMIELFARGELRYAPTFNIRRERFGDIDAIRQVNDAAFGRPAEGRLVDALRRDAEPFISFVAEENAEIVGHICFTPVIVQHAGGTSTTILGLAPMAVSPARQRRGIGSMLVEAGLADARARGYGAVVVLGRPQFYPRFGFRPAAPAGLRCVYNAPAPAFMVLELRSGALGALGGVAHYHPLFELVEEQP